MDAADLDPDPQVQLAAWLDEARTAGVVHAEAMALATATRDGVPSVRMVLLKGCDGSGLSFFTNLESRKAVELAANPRAAVSLHWQSLGRQVRAEGRVERLSDEEGQAYFDTRPRGSQLAAWASPQSRPVGDRHELELRFADTEARFAGVERPPLPPFWGGYRLLPEAYEFWQSRANRLHDRIRYERSGGGWGRVRLAP